MNHHAQVNLRALEPEDLDMLYQIENDVELWGISSTNVPYSRFVLHEFMASTTGDIYTDKQVRLVIENEQKQPIGLADIMSFDPKNRRAELGLVITRPLRRCGYAKAALQKIHQLALHTLHLHQVYVIIDADNEPSLALFRRIGYQESARLPEWLFDGKAYHEAVVLQHVL